MIDEGFIGRTYRTTAVVWAISILTITAYKLWFGAIGFTLGAAVSLGVLASLERVVRRVFVPGADSAAIKTLAKYGACKFVILIGLVFAVVMTRRFDLIAGFCAGVALTQAVIFLKALGIMILDRMGRQED